MQLLRGFKRLRQLTEKSIRLIQLGRLGDVSHVFHHDHRGLLVQHLIDGDHAAEFDQGLDDRSRLHRHLVCEIGDGNGFRHHDVAHTGSVGAAKVSADSTEDAGL